MCPYRTSCTAPESLLVGLAEKRSGQASRRIDVGEDPDHLLSSEEHFDETFDHVCGPESSAMRSENIQHNGCPPKLLLEHLVSWTASLRNCLSSVIPNVTKVAVERTPP